jgi:glutathione S-transferase
VPADAPMAKAMAHRVALALGIVEARLADVPWLGGADFTAADIMIGFTFTTMRYFVSFDLALYPAIRAYIGRFAERPAYRAAMEKGDPGMELLLS